MLASSDDHLFFLRESSDDHLLARIVLGSVGRNQGREAERRGSRATGIHRHQSGTDPRHRLGFAMTTARRTPARPPLAVAIVTLELAGVPASGRIRFLIGSPAICVHIYVIMQSKNNNAMVSAKQSQRT